jgi:hypothetical protein
MNYEKFKKEAEKKDYVLISEYKLFKSHIVSRFEIWSDRNDNFMCVEVLTNDKVIIYKQSEKV